MQKNLKITTLKKRSSGKRIPRKENLKGKMQARTAENKIKNQQEGAKKEDPRRK